MDKHQEYQLFRTTWFRLVIATNMNTVNGVPLTFFHRFDVHIDAIYVPVPLTALETTQTRVWTDIRRYAH